MTMVSVTVLAHSMILFAPTPQVRIFVNHDCPIARRYAPELNRIHQEFGKKIDFKIVYCDQELSAKAMRRHHAEFGLKMGFEGDPGMKLTQRFGIKVVPTAVVFEGKQTFYKGKIDDAYGKDYKWRKPQNFLLRDALKDILSGKPVRQSSSEPIGCALPIRK